MSMIQKRCHAVPRGATRCHVDTYITGVKRPLVLYHQRSNKPSSSFTWYACAVTSAKSRGKRWWQGYLTIVSKRTQWDHLEMKTLTLSPEIVDIHHRNTKKRPDANSHVQKDIVLPGSLYQIKPKD